MGQISPSKKGAGAQAAWLLGPVAAAGLIFGCKGSPAKLKADDTTALGETAAPLVDQTSEGHLIKSVSFDIKETTAGMIASVVTSHLDMDTAEVSFRHFVVQFSGDRLFSVIQRSGGMTLGAQGVAPSNDDRDWVADLTKIPAVVSAAKPVTDQDLADSFQGLSEALAVIKDPRSAALAAKLAGLTFDKASMKSLSNFAGMEGASVVYLHPNTKFESLRGDVPKKFAEAQYPAGSTIGSSFFLKVETPDRFQDSFGSFRRNRPMIITYTPTFLGFSALSQQLTLKLIVSANSIIVTEGGFLVGDDVIGYQNRGQGPVYRLRSGLATFRGAFAAYSDPWLRSVERYLTELEEGNPQELVKVGPFMETAASKGADGKADASETADAADAANADGEAPNTSDGSRGVAAEGRGR